MFESAPEAPVTPGEDPGEDDEPSAPPPDTGDAPGGDDPAEGGEEAPTG